MWFLNPRRLVTEAPSTIAKEKSDSFQKQRNALAAADARAAQTIASPADIILSERDGLRLEGSNPNNKL